MRDKKAGWTGRRHFFISAETQELATEAVKEHLGLNRVLHPRHPWSPLMTLARVEFAGRDGITGEWQIDAVYWLPRGRSVEVERMAAKGT